MLMVEPKGAPVLTHFLKLNLYYVYATLLLNNIQKRPLMLLLTRSTTQCPAYKFLLAKIKET